MRELNIIVLNKGGNCNSQFPTKQGKLDERSLSNDKRGLGFFHFTSCHALIASPRACKRACTRLKGKKDNKLQKERRDTTKGKEGSIKNTNSYTPSKVVNEWHNIPLFSFLKLIVEV